MKEFHKIGRAFGYVFDYGEYMAGYVFNDGEAITNGILSISPKDLPYYTLTLEGEIVLTPLNGVGSPLIMERGVSMHELAFEEGKYRVEVTKPTRHLCISRLTNQNATPSLPRCQKINISSGESHTFVAGSKVLFIDGAASVDGAEITPLRTIRFNSEKTLQATSDSFLFQFLD